MGVFKRNGRWGIDYYTGRIVKGKKERVQQIVADKRREAVGILGGIKKSIIENRYLDVKKGYNITFDELAERYRHVFKSQTSFKDKKNHIKILRERFAGWRLADFEVYDLEKLRESLKAIPVKAGTEKLREGCVLRDERKKVPKERGLADVNRTLSTLRHMFSKAVEWKLMEVSPFTMGKNLLFKEDEGRIRYLDEVELDKLFSACIQYIEKMKTDTHIRRRNMDYLLNCILIALNSGMRKGEILTLKWTQVTTGFICLEKTKTHKARQIPINDTLRELFQQLRQERMESIPKRKSEYVICNETGEPFGDIKKSFNSVLRNAEIKNFVFHDLRHTFASHLVIRGVSLKSIQSLLGHKDIRTTMRYAHIGERQLGDAVKILDSVTGKNRKSSDIVVTSADG